MCESAARAWPGVVYGGVAVPPQSLSKAKLSGGEDVAVASSVGAAPGPSASVDALGARRSAAARSASATSRQSTVRAQPRLIFLGRGSEIVVIMPYLQIIS